MNRKTLTITTLGIIIAFSAILIYYTQPLNTEIGYGDITVEQAKSLIESKPSLIILDVRTQEEYDSGHIERVILIPIDELENRLDELSKNDELLVYCRTGRRSSNAMNILQADGFTKIFHMNDGITGWIQAGYSTL
ncbi:rhodanese-like domain-containing protein [Candidatus Bathyarchaeota archaeon]|nr:rhodanese-like domain-containing protein [Candidatus Bathyarchaeota archaeon]